MSVTARIESWVPLDVAHERSMQLQVLDAFSRLCEEEGLRWFACGGTLLGAIRHRGYIPWDDDIDVMMPRADYERLLGLGGDMGGDGTFRIASLATDADYYLPFARIWHRDTCVTAPYEPWPRVGVGIDVLPIDVRPGSRLGIFLQNLGIRIVRFLLAARISTPMPSRPGWKNAALRGIRAFLLLVRPRMLGRILTGLSDRSGSNQRQEHAGVVVWGVPDRVPASAFASSVPVTFEQRTLHAPVGWREWLEEVYGDFMTLPSESARQSHHHFQGFARQQPSPVSAKSGIHHGLGVGLGSHQGSGQRRDCRPQHRSEG